MNDVTEQSRPGNRIEEPPQQRQRAPGHPLTERERNHPHEAARTNQEGSDAGVERGSSPEVGGAGILQPSWRRRLMTSYRRFFMNTKWAGVAGALLLLMASAMGARADDRSDYNGRAAARDLSLFHSLDRNADGAVTRAEAQGDINFLPRFNDMETNLDGIVTTQELHRYLEQKYGVQVSRK
ncbi:MAG TPA: hypothetical protein VLA81_07550 [Burkholderiales bacterium]|nr:hypothetical protein [Burkholderiales bacterium]